MDHRGTLFQWKYERYLMNLSSSTSYRTYFYWQSHMVGINWLTSVSVSCVSLAWSFPSLCMTNVSADYINVGVDDLWPLHSPPAENFQIFSIYCAKSHIKSVCDCVLNSKSQRSEIIQLLCISRNNLQLISSIINYIIKLLT